MLYGVGVGFNPLMVFASTLAINILTVFVSMLVVDKLLEWKKGVRCWLEKRTSRGQKFLNKYAWIGVLAGVFVFSPMQVAIIGRLVGIHPNKFYLPLIVGTTLSAVVSMAIALGIFKLILGW